MKLLTIQLPDDAEITIEKGKTGLSVSDGENTIEGGELIAITDMEDPKFVAPTEPVMLTLGPPPEPEEEPDESQ